jgi:predicted glycoside hydrolase/deacetylase ChbG (UPF0249 family)
MLTSNRSQEDVESRQLAARRLIVNADDFGRSEGVNAGVCRAHSSGIVTSASLMVRWPAAAEAVAMSFEHPNLDLGLHLDFGEWTYENSEWRAVYEVVSLKDPAAVVAETNRQIERFQELTGRSPTHLDSHQHVHRELPARRAIVELARSMSIPLRHCTPAFRYCGDFYGQSSLGEPVSEAITAASLIAIFRDLEPGTTELACHPAAFIDHDTMYGQERIAELEALCDGRVRLAIEELKIELWSFAQQSRAQQS